MRVVWPCENSPNDPPEYLPEEEAAAMKAAEEKLMRKKAAGLLRPQSNQSAANAPAPATKQSTKVKVIRDEDGTIIGFERQ